MREWKRSTIGGIIKQKGGKIQSGPFGSQLHAHEYSDVGTPVVMPKDIEGGRINLTKCARVEQSIVDRLARHKLETGEIVFPRRGDITKCSLITNEESGFICGTGCLKIRLSPSVIDSSFLYYYLNLESSGYWLENNAVGSTMKNLSATIMKRFPLKYPDLPTQQKIARRLSRYDDLIEVNLRRIGLLEALARETYAEWFVRGRFPGWEDGSHQPIDSWEKMTCYDVVEVMSGGTPKTKIDEYWNGNIGFFTPKDASTTVYVNGTEKTVTSLGASKCNSKLYPKDTIFITARGTVGKVNLANEAMIMNQSCYALKGKRHVTQYYLYCAMVNTIDVFKGMATGGVFNTIVIDTFRILPFSLPPDSLVQEFEKFATPVFGHIHNLLQQNTRLREARDLLLPRLMAGVEEV